MRKKRFVFIIGIVLLAFAIITLYRFLYLSQPEKTIKMFLDNLITSPNDRLFSYMDKHVDREHPL